MANYSDIELTEEEANEALRLARKKKSTFLQEQAYWDKVRKPVEFAKLSVIELRSKIISENPDFVLDESNSHIFDMLCAYFSGDQSFEMFGSFKKGIMLYGPVGCGKTSLMRMFSVNSFRPFGINPVRKIADEYASKDGGVLALNKFSSMIDVYAHEYYGHNQIGRCFDDVGTEESKKNFGNEVNVIQDVLYKIYDSNQFSNFHLTTNLSGDEIESLYGHRIRSRMREMFNVIKFDTGSPDRRK